VDPVKIYIFPADTTGCGYYRLIWPARELQRQGHDVVIVTSQERDQMLQAKLDGDHVVQVRIPQDADVIVFQRVTHRYLVQAIPIIRNAGTAVVVDMDDDLTCIHPANPAFHALHPSGPNAVHSWQNTLLACDAASLVTVSTDALATRYGAKTPVHILRNCVPERYLKIEHTDSNVIGWAGSVHSHPTDLQVMGPSMAQLLQLGCQFRVAGPLAGVHTALGVSTRYTIDTTDVIRDINAWPLAVNTIGIGVAPLADSKFNAAKSWLKPLEYAAVGVPCVMSPRAEYSRLARLGVGLLAKNSHEWRKYVHSLVKSADRRTESALAGRDAAAKLTIERNAWRWLDAWTRAVTLERETSGT